MKFARIALLTLAAFIALPGIGALAQSYNLPAPYVCAAASTQPVTSFSQFSCSGLFYDSGQIQVYFNAGVPAFEIWTPDFSVSEYNSAMSLTNFTQPSGGNPGTLAFNWTGTDSAGMLHTGLLSATWIQDRACSNRCWYHPKIVTSVMTIN